MTNTTKYVLTTHPSSKFYAVLMVHSAQQKNAKSFSWLPPIHVPDPIFWMSLFHAPMRFSILQLKSSPMKRKRIETKRIRTQHEAGSIARLVWLEDYFHAIPSKTQQTNSNFLTNLKTNGNASSIHKRSIWTQKTSAQPRAERRSNRHFYGRPTYNGLSIAFIHLR